MPKRRKGVGGRPPKPPPGFAASPPQSWRGGLPWAQSCAPPSMARPDPSLEDLTPILMRLIQFVESCRDELAKTRESVCNLIYPGELLSCDD